MSGIAKAVILIATVIIFTLIGLGAGIAVTLRRTSDFRDQEGMITSLTIMVPTAGGLVAGVAVGAFALGAASVGPKP